MLVGSSLKVINPDHFLETEKGRLWTAERSKEAWAQCYATLAKYLSDRSRLWTVAIVCGLQGAGKTTWINQQEDHAGTIYFDAALPGARHRRPIIDIALSAGADVEAVWIKSPLSLALARNAQRSPDTQVPESSIRSVDEQFEAPVTSEGFTRIRTITPQQ